MKHCALVRRSEPVDLATSDDDSPSNVRDEIVAIYQSYAELYPNPRLAEELAERDRLLKQAAEERRANDSAATNSTAPPSQRGFFGFLWSKKAKETPVQAANTIEMKEDEVLVYGDFVEDDPNHRDALCGTMSALAISCIPQEAHSAARYHLAAATSRSGRPILVQSSGGQTMAIVGLGVIAELRQADDAEGTTPPIIQHTSDRDDLLAYRSSLDTIHNLSYARGTALGLNCLAISWGFLDGIVAVYRRIDMQNEATQVGWECVAMVTPTPAVLDNLHDMFAHDVGGGIASSSLLCVTELASLTVDAPGAETSRDVVTLAVTRLGGFIELVPVSSGVWDGPVLSRKHHKSPRRRRKRHANLPEHYCVGLVPNLSDATTGATALTTSSHHVDIVSLAVYRTQVGSDTEWDMDAFPDSPPAEYVLAACGTRDGREIITFWAVATIFHQSEHRRPPGPSWSLHVALVDVLDLGSMGASFSIFANDVILRHWRKARSVQIRSGDAMQGSETNGTAGQMAAGNALTSIMKYPLSTVSLSAPVTCMRVKPGGPPEGEGAQTRSDALLAVLDSNGAVTVVDCSTVIDVASQYVSKDRYLDMHQSGRDDRNQTLSSILSSRRESLLRKRTHHGAEKPARLVDAAWLMMQKPSESTSVTKFALVLLDETGRLHVTDAAHQDELALFSSTDYVSPDGCSILGYANAEMVNIAVCTRLQNANTRLCFFALQRLGAKRMLEMLLRMERFAEAVEFASQSGLDLSSQYLNLMETCRKRLWEKERRIEYLTAVTDESYLVEEILNLFDSDMRSSVGHLSLENVLDACELVLRRLENTRLASALKLGGASGVAEAKANVTVVFTRASTFVLLCQILGSTPSFERCRECFIHSSLEELGRSLALLGDIPALTLLICRHRSEVLPSLLAILSCIPASIDPSLYCHLLPVLSLEARGQDRFLAYPEDNDFRHWSSMGSYLKDALHVSPFLNEFEEKIVLETLQSTGEVALRDGTDESAKVARWCLDRAKDIEQTTGNFSHVALFSDCALKCLGVAELSETAGDSSPEIQQLHMLRSGAAHLNRMLLDVIDPSFQAASSSASTSIKVSELYEMDSVDAISMIIGSECDPQKVLSSFRTGVEPILALSTSPSDGPLLDSAVAAYCLRRIRETPMRISSADPARVKSLRDTMSICATIADASQSLVKKSGRIIKDKRKLIRFVLDVSSECFALCQGMSLLPSESNHLVALLWEMYECLPVRAGDHVGDPAWNDLHQAADALYRRLVSVDILSSWYIPEVFSCFEGLQSTFRLEDWNAAASLKLVETLCGVFCREISVAAHSVDQEGKARLLRYLLSDLNQLYTVVFEDHFELGQTLQDNLVKPLLLDNQFELLGELAITMNESLLQKHDIQSSVLAFVSESMFVDSKKHPINTDRLQSAIRCQDVLLPFFPGLQAEFSSMRRYLDAAHFANTVLRGESGAVSIHPAEARDKPALDVVESVLQANPLATVEGCKQWLDSSFARNSNQAIVDHFQSSAQANTEETYQRTASQLPPLPGAAVYHLASILGLDYEAALVVVKSRVVHHAVASGYFGAAAAVCLTLLYDKDTSWDADADAVLRINSMLKVISTHKYDDFLTKKGLCVGAFRRFGGNFSIAVAEPFQTILRLYPSIERRTSVLQPSTSQLDKQASEQGRSTGDHGMQQATNDTSGRSDFFVFRAANAVAKSVSTHMPPSPGGPHEIRDITLSTIMQPFAAAYHDILAQYATNIHDLFSVLQVQAADGTQDDQLLLTLGRLILFWCISDFVRIRPWRCRYGIERAVLRHFISLGASLFLQVRDQASLVSIVGELQGIVNSEVSKAMERVSALVQPNIEKPDPEIVRRLVGRGYSANGSRRSAIMSGNQSFDAAIAWAVSHTLDEGFDEPLVFLRTAHGPTGSECLDQVAIHCLTKAVALVGSSAKGEKDSIVSLRKELDRSCPKAAALPTRWESTAIKADTVVATKKTFPARPPEVREGMQSTAAISMENGSRKRIHRAPESTPTATLQVRSKTKESTPPTGRTTMRAVALDAVAGDRSTATRTKPALPPVRVRAGGDGKLSSQNLSKTPPPPPPSAPSSTGSQRLSRRSHREGSQQVLAKDERQRLIEEGRRMLEQARSAKRSDSAGSSGSERPRPSRYPLRSRLLAAEKAVGTTRTAAAKPENPPEAVTLDESKDDKAAEDTMDGWDFDDF